MFCIPKLLVVLKHLNLRCLVALIILLLNSSLPAPATEFFVFDVVGDSVSAGTNPELGVPYGWVDMMFGETGPGPDPVTTDTIHTLWPGITIHNSAASGSLAADWASTSSAMLQTVLDHKPDLVVVMIGGNDFLAAIVDGGFDDAEKEQLRASVDSIIARLQSNTPRPTIILANYYDFFDGYSANLPHPYDFFGAFSAATLEAIAVLDQIAAERGCRLVDVYSPFYHHCYGRDLGDPAPLEPPYLYMPLFFNFDIHPVTAGHRRIYELIYEELAALKRAPAGSGWMIH